MYKIISYLFIFFAVLTNLGKADIVDKLTDLNNLYKEGALNEEEFKKAKEIPEQENNQTDEDNIETKVEKNNIETKVEEDNLKD